MSEWSQLIILSTTLKSINPAFKAQFNTLTDDTPTEAILKALDHIKASHHAAPSSDAILYAGQADQHHYRNHQHQVCPGPLQPPSGPHGQSHCQGWSGSQNKWCSHHSSRSHSLEQCHKAASLRSPQTTMQAATLAAMTAAAIAATAALPPHTPQTSIFAAMTAATAATCPSDFAIIAESDVGAAVHVLELVSPNKQHHTYSIFSLMSPVQLPMIADTSATQHTTNRQDLLHDFVPLAIPSLGVC